jgi:hypothetical protein
MAMHDMFLAMVLTNAKRAEARALVFTVDPDQARIDMLLLDGSSQQLQAPPPEVIVKIIELLDEGERNFQSSVYAATVEKVQVMRGPDRVQAYVSEWSIDHN